MDEGESAGTAAAQCQARSKRSGKRCRRWARLGYPVCPMHGAGSARRERAGIRENPRLAPLKTGQYASPETLELYAQMHPKFAERVDHYRNEKEKLRDLDELLARLWALADIMAEAPQEIVTTEYGQQAPALAGLLSRLIDALERVARIEGRIRDGGITVNVGQVNVVVESVVEVMAKYVDPGSLNQAIEDLEQRLERALPDSTSAPTRAPRAG